MPVEEEEQERLMMQRRDGGVAEYIKRSTPRDRRSPHTAVGVGPLLTPPLYRIGKWMLVDKNTNKCTMCLAALALGDEYHLFNLYSYTGLDLREIAEISATHQVTRTPLEPADDR